MLNRRKHSRATHTIYIVPLALVTTLMFWAFPSLTIAIVNIETLRSAKATNNLEADVALNFSDGNTESLDFSGGFGLRLPSEKFDWLAIASGELRERQEARFSRKAFAHLRYHLFPGKNLSEEFFAQAQYDENLNLSSRTLLGAGLRLKLKALLGAGDSGDKESSESERSSRLFFGTALMYESEKLHGNDRALSIIRISSYLSIKLSNSKLAFTSISYVQPRADDFADVRLTTENEFSSDIGSGFKFTVSFSGAYDARPPGVVEEWDFATRAGLKYAWSGS